MKNNLPLQLDRVRRKGLAVISCFLFVACMQHDESLAPKGPPKDPSSSLPSAAEGAGSMHKKTFTAHLKSSNEVNPAGVISNAQGQAIFKLSDDGQSLHYKLIVANIENVTQAHIHCGEAGVNGPVVLFLYGLNADGITLNGELAEGVLTPANLIPRPDSGSCVGGLMTWDDLLERLMNGTSYVNVHTIAYPGGEVRGQIR